MRSPYDIAAIDAVVNIRTPELLAQRPRRENFYSAKMHVETFIEGMRGVRELEQAVRQYGFIGAHFYPHWFELAPDHAKWPTEGAAAHARAVHGAARGAGLIRGVPVERFYRDVRHCRVGEGASEVQRMPIARDLLRS